MLRHLLGISASENIHFVTSVQNVKARAPLPAGASTERGVEVETTEDHRKRTNGAGCQAGGCFAFRVHHFSFAPSKNRPKRDQCLGGRILNRDPRGENEDTPSLLVVGRG